jgi:signal peptidase I
MDEQKQNPDQANGAGQPASANNAPQQYPLDQPMPAQTPPPANPLQSTPSPAPAPQPSEEPPSQLSNIAGGFSTVLGAIFSWVIFPVAVVLILHNFVFQAYHVLGTSMVPTLHETDYLIISKVGYTQALVERAFGKNDPYIPKRGQIIVFRYPKDPSKVFVKRVIGLPGERVVIKNGAVTVYNKEHPQGFSPDTNYR